MTWLISFFICQSTCVCLVPNLKSSVHVPVTQKDQDRSWHKLSTLGLIILYFWASVGFQHTLNLLQNCFFVVLPLNPSLHSAIQTQAFCTLIKAWTWIQMVTPGPDLQQVHTSPVMHRNVSRAETLG